MDDLLYGPKTCTIPLNTRGWAVFGGVDGEDPCFLSFHAHEEDARAAQKAHDAEYSTDSDVVPAVLTPTGLVCSNDVAVSSHDALFGVIFAEAGRATSGAAE